MITDLKKVWRLVDSPLVSILWLLALGCAGLELLLAQVIQSVMQHAAFTVSMITLAAATALVIGLGRFVMAKLQTRGQYQLIQRIQTQLMAALMNGPIATDNQASGRRVNGFTTDAQTAAPLLMRSMTALVVGGFSFLAAGTFGLFSSWQLTLLIIGLCATALLIPKMMSGRLQTAQNQRQIENSQMQESLLQILNGRELLKSYQKEQFGMQLFNGAYQKFSQAQYQMGMQQVKTVVMGFSLGLVFDIAILGIELLFVGFKVITIGQFAAFSMLTPSFTWLFYSMPSQYAELTRNLVSAKRLLPLIQSLHKEELAGGQSRQKPAKFVLRNVTYTYPDATQPTLNQLQLKLDVTAHAKMLITGPSGGGKSTLLRLMLGLLVPQAGTIQFEDTDKRDLAASANSMSFVPQVVALFEDTLANNVTLGRQVSDQQLTLVLHQVGLTDFIARLPQGLATLVHGQDGVNVSAGELQKIGIARALLAQRPMLLLDEPFANLDAASAQTLGILLRQLPVAMIVISHRHDIGRFWDHAVVLKDGQLHVAGEMLPGDYSRKI